MMNNGVHFKKLAVAAAFIVAVAFAVVCSVIMFGVVDALPADPEERARALMTRYPLIDGHNDIPHKFRTMVSTQITDIDLQERDVPDFDTDIPRLRDGLLGGQFWSVYTPCSTQFRDAVRVTQEQIDVALRMVEMYPQTFALATRADDIEPIFGSGRIPSLMGMEGAHQIDSSLASLRMFHRQGVRYMTLTHNCNTPEFESCCGGESPWGPGVTAFGAEVIKEMNRIGMFIDLSHTSPQTMHDVLDISTAPVIFSHSNAFALCNTARNVPDDVLDRLPQNGGVVMVTFVPSFLTCSSDASSTDVADHIDYIVNRIGVQHVGIGADYDGIDNWPSDLRDVSTYPVLIAELIRRGYSDEDVIAILGGNVLRAMRQMEAASGTPGPNEALVPRWENECRTFMARQESEEVHALA